MKGIPLLLLPALVCCGFTDCLNDQAQPTSPPETLNITGHWVYNAIFAKNDSIWRLRSQANEPFNLNLTNSNEKLAGTLKKSLLLFCKELACFDSTGNLGGHISRAINADKSTTFGFVRIDSLNASIDSVKIENTGLANVMRTDLPPGSALRMTMNGTAKIYEKKTMKMIREGFFSAERLV